MKLLTIWDAFRQAESDLLALKEFYAWTGNRLDKRHIQIERRQRQVYRFADHIIDHIGKWDEGKYGV